MDFCKLCKSSEREADSYPTQLSIGRLCCESVTASAAASEMRQSKGVESEEIGERGRERKREVERCHRTEI